MIICFRVKNQDCYLRGGGENYNSNPQILVTFQMKKLGEQQYNSSKQMLDDVFNNASNDQKDVEENAKKETEKGNALNDKLRKKQKSEALSNHKSEFLYIGKKQSEPRDERRILEEQSLNEYENKFLNHKKISQIEKLHDNNEKQSMGFEQQLSRLQLEDPSCYYLSINSHTPIEDSSRNMCQVLSSRPEERYWDVSEAGLVGERREAKLRGDNQVKTTNKQEDEKMDEKTTFPIESCYGKSRKVNQSIQAGPKIHPIASESEDILKNEICLNYAAIFLNGVCLLYKTTKKNSNEQLNSFWSLVLACSFIILGTVSISFIQMFFRLNGFLGRKLFKKVEPPPPPVQTSLKTIPLNIKGTQTRIAKSRTNNSNENKIVMYKKPTSLITLLVMTGSLTFLGLIEYVRILEDFRGIFLPFFAYHQLLVAQKLSSALFSKKTTILILLGLIIFAVIRSTLFLGFQQKKSITITPSVTPENIVIEIIFAISIFLQHLKRRILSYQFFTFTSPIQVFCPQTLQTQPQIPIIQSSPKKTSLGVYNIQKFRPHQRAHSQNYKLNQNQRQNIVEKQIKYFEKVNIFGQSYKNEEKQPIIEIQKQTQQKNDIENIQLLVSSQVQNEIESEELCPNIRKLSDKQSNESQISSNKSSLSMNECNPPQNLTNKLEDFDKSIINNQFFKDYPDLKRNKCNSFQKIYQDILNVIPEGVALINNQNKIVYLNKALPTILKCQKEDIMSILLKLTSKERFKQKEEEESTEQCVSPYMQAITKEPFQDQCIDIGQPPDQLQQLTKPSLFNRFQIYPVVEESIPTFNSIKIGNGEIDLADQSKQVGFQDGATDVKHISSYNPNIAQTIPSKKTNDVSDVFSLSNCMNPQNSEMMQQQDGPYQIHIQKTSHVETQARGSIFKNTQIVHKDVNVKDILGAMFENYKQIQDQDYKTAKSFQVHKQGASDHPNKNISQLQNSFLSNSNNSNNLGYFQYVDDKVRYISLKCIFLCYFRSNLIKRGL